MNETIYISEDASPPKRKEDSVRQLCKISFICPVKFDELERHENDEGKVVRIFRFQVRMTSYGSSVEFEIRYGDKSLGEQKLDVQFEDYRPAPPTSLSGIDLSAAGFRLSPTALIDRPNSPLVERLRVSRPTSRILPSPVAAAEQQQSKVVADRRKGSPMPSLRQKYSSGSSGSSGTLSPFSGFPAGLEEKPGNGFYPRSGDGGYLAELEVPYQPIKPIVPQVAPTRPLFKPKDPDARTPRRKSSTVSLVPQKDGKSEKSSLFSRFKKH